MDAIDQPDVERADLAVVGGGLAGLVAAITAARAGSRVVLVEGRALGGRARVEHPNGFTFNRGPRALYVDGPGRAVLARLGVPLDHGRAPAASPSSALRGGRLHVLPAGATTLLRTSLLPIAEKPGAAWLLGRLPRMDPARFAGMTTDEAIATMGAGPVTSDVVRALVRLTSYMAATDVLDAEAAVRQVQSGLVGVHYLDGGWGTLVASLRRAAEAAGVRIHEGTAVREVVHDGGGAVVVGADGARLAARTVVVAAGGLVAAAGLVRGLELPPLGPPVHAACLELGLRQPPRTRLVLGIDEPLYLSTHCPPADLAPPGGAVVHLMRYARPGEDLAHDVVHRRLRALARAAGVRDDDVVEERFLARMTVSGAVPVAPHGLAGRPAVADPARPAVLLAGDWVGPVGLLADAALASGAAAGRAAAERRGRLAVA